MRRTLPALALVLAACSQAPEEPTAEPLTVIVDGGLGSPAISTVDGDLPEDADVLVDVEGRGRELAGDSPVLYSISSFNDDGELLAGTERPVLSTAADMPIDVVGLTEGSRVLSVNPQEGGAEILVLDIFHTAVRGDELEIGGPLAVSVDDENVPVLEGTTEVRALSTQVVIRGAGPQIGPEDDIYVQYSLYRASDGELLDSTWEDSPILLSLSDTFEGLRTGAEDSPIGSRLLIQVPAGQAQGTEDLAIILDILALG